MAQPQETPSSRETEVVSMIMPAAISNTTITNMLLKRHAQNPHQLATDIATRKIHEDEKMNIVHKTGAKKNWENHAIGCEL
jgi:hypothetical protein